MQNKNHYTTLGVNRTANAKEIKSAYRVLAKKFHPDKNLGNLNVEEQFKEAQFAYSILSDIEKRRQYDLKFSNDNNYSRPYHYSRNNRNTYQYAQQEAQKYDQYDATDTPITKQYRTELYQIIISVIIALLLLYFIVSY